MRSENSRILSREVSGKAAAGYVNDVTDGEVGGFVAVRVPLDQELQAHESLIG
jgi:hypothetical protein